MGDLRDVPEGEPVYLRDLDGTGSMHVCSKEDPGAVEYVPTALQPAPMSVAEALSKNDIYYLKAIQRRLDEFRDALDGIEGLSIGGEAFSDEIDWLDTFIDAKSRALASPEGE